MKPEWSKAVSGFLALVALTNGACSSKDTSVTHPSDAGRDGSLGAAGGATGVGGKSATGGATSHPASGGARASGGGAGISDATVPVTDAHREPILGAAIAAGTNHMCLLTTTGRVRCWGSDEHGEVGNPDSVGRGNNPGTHEVPGLAGAIAVSAGFDESCAILADHKAWCWGNNDNGQLGRGTALPPDAAPHVLPGLVAGVDGAIQIAIGATHACAVLGTGELACWGSHEDGERGANVDGGAMTASTPSLIAFQPSVVVKQVATGASFTCALTSLGTVICFGDNSVGQLGRPGQTAQKDPVPTMVPSLANVTEIAAGGSTACALQKSGVIQCWGWGTYGQLGRGPNDGASPLPGPTPLPVALPAGRTAKHVALSPTGSKLPEGIGCALLDDDTVACWGSNAWGQTGSGTVGSNTYVTPAAIFTPAVVKGIAGKPVAVAPAQFHGCALLENGGATCWGNNGGGQLGADPNVMAGGVPVPVPVIYEYRP